MYPSFMELPPPLELALDLDLASLTTPEDVVPFLSGGIREELQRQAEWALANYNYDLPLDERFAVCPIGPSNPLSFVK